jgi:hypothetical protein
MFNPKLRGIIFATAAAAIVSGCGADDIASPGTGGGVTINNPPAPPPPPTPPPPPATVVAAAVCPTITDAQGLVDSGIVSGPTGTYRTCTLPARINTSSTLPKVTGVLYRLGGRVDVGTDQGPSTTNTAVTLTIAPGVIVYGGTGVSWLNVNRGNKLNAIGTAALPIVFTSLNNVIGANTDSTIGQWGGVVLNGRAPITDCAAPAAAPGTAACERQVEGAVDPALYGGANSADSSGQLSYVQIRYSGFVLSGNSELQSLTTGGVGSGTILDHIQSFNSSDDGAEFFGGSVNMKYFVSIGADDDNLDTDTGVKANFQYVLAVQRAGAGDSMIEADSNNALDGNIPRQNTRLSNFTFIQRNNTGNAAAIFLRGGTDYTLANGVVISPNTSCLRISRAQTASTAVNATIDEEGAPLVRSVVAQCGTPAFVGSDGVTEAQVSAIFGSGANGNNSALTPTLTSLFINGASETAVAAFNASTLNPYFDVTTYIGAVKDATDTWYAGWTCNSATATLGTSTSGLCTSLPTF